MKFDSKHPDQLSFKYLLGFLLCKAAKELLLTGLGWECWLKRYRNKGDRTVLCFMHVFHGLDCLKIPSYRNKGKVYKALTEPLFIEDPRGSNGPKTRYYDNIASLWNKSCPVRNGHKWAFHLRKAQGLEVRRSGESILVLSSNSYVSRLWVLVS